MQFTKNDELNNNPQQWISFGAKVTSGTFKDREFTIYTIKQFYVDEKVLKKLLT